MSLLERIRRRPAAFWTHEHPFAALPRGMDRLLDELATERGSLTPEWLGTAFPRVNLSDTVESVRVTAELPGMERQDIDVAIEGGALVISGEKTDEKEEKGRNWHRRERTSGSFRRMVALPADVDTAKVDATFKDGVLTIEIARSMDEASRPKKVEVKSA